MKRQDWIRWVAAIGGTRNAPVRKRRLIAVAVVLMVPLGIGCGSSDNPPPAPTGTPTPTATSTSTTIPSPTATTTPLPDIAGQENLFGSTVQGGGALTIDAVPQIPTYFSACLGADDPNCTGGTTIYIGTDPGFKEADESEATAPLFALPDGVTVGLQVVSIDPALSLKFDDGTLNAAGQSLELGTTPGIHADLEWQLALPGGTAFGRSYPVTLKLTTTSSGFTDSAEFTEVVRPSSGSPPPPSDD
jgi:hypothetical protein